MSWREAYLLALMPTWPEDQEPFVDVRPTAVVREVLERIEQEQERNRFPDVSQPLVTILRELTPEVFDFWDEETLAAVDQEFRAKMRFPRPAALFAINPRLEKDTANVFFLRQQRSHERVQQMRLFFLYNPIAPSVLHDIPTMGDRTPVDATRSHTHRGHIVIDIQIEEIVAFFESGLEANEYNDRVGMSRLDLVPDAERVKLLAWLQGELEFLRSMGSNEPWTLDSLMFVQSVQTMIKDGRSKQDVSSFVLKREAYLEDQVDLYKYVFHLPEHGDPIFLQNIFANLPTTMMASFGVNKMSESFLDWSVWVMNSTRRLERALGLAPTTFMMDRVL